LQNQQVGETVRELGLAGQNEKRERQPWRFDYHIISTLVPVMLFANLNIYVCVVDCNDFVDGNNRFVDDYIKIFKR
jgi:phospho-N-acetylmuramoyl-pentapeptide-transferase